MRCLQNNCKMSEAKFQDIQKIMYAIKKTRTMREKGMKCNSNDIWVDLSKYTEDSSSTHRSILVLGMEKIRLGWTTFLNCIYDSIYPLLEDPLQPVVEFRGEGGSTDQRIAFLAIVKLIGELISQYLFNAEVSLKFPTDIITVVENQKHDHDRSCLDDHDEDYLVVPSSNQFKLNKNTIEFITSTGNCTLLESAAFFLFLLFCF